MRKMLRGSYPDDLVAARNIRSGGSDPYDIEVHWTAKVDHMRGVLSSMVIHAFNPSGFATLHYHVPSQLALLNNTSSSYTSYALEGILVTEPTSGVDICQPRLTT